jgi:hypothetical protein
LCDSQALELVVIAYVWWTKLRRASFSWLVAETIFCTGKETALKLLAIRLGTGSWAACRTLRLRAA